MINSVARAGVKQRVKREVGLTWRYGFNLAPTVAHHLRPLPLSAEARRVFVEGRAGIDRRRRRGVFVRRSVRGRLRPGPVDAFARVEIGREKVGGEAFLARRNVMSSVRCAAHDRRQYWRRKA